MRQSIFLPAVLLAVLCSAPPARAAEEAFSFFEEEARVVSASRLPTPAAEAPATVYVVTAAEIEASGARTVYDALRGVPGVDAIATRARHGEVAIRGLGRALQHRVLVLLDGRVALNGYFDFMIWEELPIPIEEIDRIEVLQGPGSALYGGNAVNGVINIVTKSPAQLRGTRLRYAGGERLTHAGAFLQGYRAGDWDFKTSGEWGTAGGFAEADRPASRARKLHLLGLRRFGKRGEAELAGGIASLNTELTTGGQGTAFADGESGFVRAELREGSSRVRAYLNSSRMLARELSALGEPRLDSDTIDLSARRAFAPAERHEIVAEAGYRRNAARSEIFAPGWLAQDLWSLAAEHRWRARRGLTLVLGGRLDRHPFTPLELSPRAAAVWRPAPDRTWRLSAGRAFRFPTLLENYLDFTRSDPAGVAGFTTRETSFTGNRGLVPERSVNAELFHARRWGPLHADAAAFGYRLSRVIAATTPELLSAVPPTLRVRSGFRNWGDARAWGIQWGLAWRASPELSLRANHTWQSITDEGAQLAPTAPRNKVNAGLRWRRERLSAGLDGHWVGPTAFNRAAPGTAVVFAPLADYATVDASAGWAPSGRAKGIELRLSVFNLLDRRHFEILPSEGPLAPGQGGEIIGRRAVATVSWSFR